MYPTFTQVTSFIQRATVFGRLLATVDLQSSNNDRKLDPNLGRCPETVCAASSLSLSKKGHLEFQRPLSPGALTGLSALHAEALLAAALSDPCLASESQVRTNHWQEVMSGAVAGAPRRPQQTRNSRDLPSPCGVPCSKAPASRPPVSQRTNLWGAQAATAKTQSSLPSRTAKTAHLKSKCSLP